LESLFRGWFANHGGVVNETNEVKGEPIRLALQSMKSISLTVSRLLFPQDVGSILNLVNISGWKIKIELALIFSYFGFQPHIIAPLLVTLFLFLFLILILILFLILILI